MKMVNKKNKQKQINSCLRFVDKSFKLVKNYVKPCTGNTDEHETAKFIKCLNLMRDGLEIYTEVRLIGGGIADILVPERFQIIEILHSETEERLRKKIKKYPKELDIIYFFASDILLNTEKKASILS